MSPKENVISIRGAKVHNLKNIDLDIPRNKLVVITGISGSGKSSLAFDTLYAEGQRRYVESLSAYARQFLGIMQKPDVERIDGISPAISIDQREAMHNPRSTVGTITEIYDYLRLLYARVGIPHCPHCGKIISRQTVDQITSQVLKLKKHSEIAVLGPMVKGKKGEHQAILEEARRSGFVRARINGIVYSIEEAGGLQLDKNKKHSIEIVVDRLVIDEDLERSRLVDSLETALRIGKGVALVHVKEGPGSIKGEDLIFSEHFACEDCAISLPELEPRLFSFNSPYGACSECTGLGEKLEVDPKLVMPNVDLTIAEGAIIPWMRASHRVGRQGYYWQQLSQLADKKGFSLDEPVRNLSPKIIEVILKGEETFEGVIPNLERRYHDTDSEWTREEIERYMVIRKCPSCLGKRLKPEVLAVQFSGKSIHEVSSIPVDDLQRLFRDFTKDGERLKLSDSDRRVAQPIIKEIANRLQFLLDVGLNYLALNRKAGTLSGGEEQRIRLATQMGSRLTGVLYILDEPSVGLHPRDQGKLIKTFEQLRDLGNTIVVVEHDSQTIMAADWVIEIGPGAGKHGGQLVFEGTPQKLMKSNCLTGQYLSGKKTIEVPGHIISTDDRGKNLIIKGARENNLKNIDVRLPLGKFICVTGVSGSGKSSLVSDIVAKALMKRFYRAKEEPGEHTEIKGAEFLDKVVLVDQSPIGRTPRSNPATYTAAFMIIRDLFAATREARMRGYNPGRFSFNVKGGRCEACEGQGQIKVEMYFLPDIYVECQECKAQRYNKEALSILYRGKNIAQVLEMTVEESLEFFKNIPALHQKLKTLNEVGLSYVQLGQPAPSLSGGEAQRVKLATELAKKATGRTLYILDEPTTGLHFEDIKKLIIVLRGLVSKGNTVLTIEHNMDFIRNSDWIIDLGPEGGEQGGKIIAQGTPEQISKIKKSHTGRFLKR